MPRLPLTYACTHAAVPPLSRMRADLVSLFVQMSSNMNMGFTPASGKDMLFLESENNVVNIHPVVMFSILDHYIRRVEGQKRVIGTRCFPLCFGGPNFERVLSRRHASWQRLAVRRGGG